MPGLPINLDKSKESGIDAGDADGISLAFFLFSILSPFFLSFSGRRLIAG